MKAARNVSQQSTGIKQHTNLRKKEPKTTFEILLNLDNQLVITTNQNFCCIFSFWAFCIDQQKRQLLKNIK